MTISQYGYVIQLCIELFGFIGFCKSENWKWTWNGCWWNPQKDGFQQQHVRIQTKKNVLDLDPKSIFLTTERFPDPPATPFLGPDRGLVVLTPRKQPRVGADTPAPPMVMEYPPCVDHFPKAPWFPYIVQALPPAPPSQFRNGATVLTQISGRSRWRVPTFIDIYTIYTWFCQAKKNEMLLSKCRSCSFKKHGVVEANRLLRRSSW